MHKRECRGPFQTSCPLVLASGSPRRLEFLRNLGLEFRVVSSDVPEPPFDGEDPAAYALSMAESKGVFVAAMHPETWIVSADTIVVTDRQVLGKPKTSEEAASMLQSLSGRWHEVISAFCIMNQSRRKSYGKSVQSRVKFKKLTAAEIKSYVATGECMDKAGAYAVQGMGAFMIEKIQGSYTNVIGLPLCELVDGLLYFGIITPVFPG
ncbi:MAG: Maf family protein [Pseudomonadota bacterium]